MLRKVLFAILILILGGQVLAQCPPNMDAEYGNFTSWQGFSGFNTTSGPPGTVNLSALTPGFTGKHSIVNAGGHDPDVGWPFPVLPQVLEGQHAFMLGGPIPAGEMTAMSITYTVPADNPFFSFQFAYVAQRTWNHHMQDMPFFKYWVSTSNNIVTSDQPGNLIDGKTFVDDGNDPWMKMEEGQVNEIMYRPWKSECVNLNEFVGQTVTIYFLVSDCVPKGHWARVYIDGYCLGASKPVHVLQQPPKICHAHTLFANGTGSYNYDDYFWKLEKLRTPNLWDVIPGTDAMQVFIGQPITFGFPIQQMYEAAGKTFGGGYYKLTLGLRNCSCNGEWFEKSVIVEVEYPSITPIIGYSCCVNNNPSSALIAADIGLLPGTTAGTVSWYDENGVFLGNGSTTTTGSTVHASISVTGVTTVSKFRVKYVTGNGCTNEGWVYAVQIPGFFGTPHISIVDCPSGICGPRRLRASWSWHGPCFAGITNEHMEFLENAFRYQWNTGETTKEIVTNFVNEDYYCTITWPCDSQQLATVHVPSPPFSGPFQQLNYTTAMAYMTGNFRVFGTTLNDAYNATGYRLQIRDNLGGLIYEKYDAKTSCFGYQNGDISWNGIGNQGSYNNIRVPADEVYYFFLQLQNCSINDINSNDVSLKGDFYIDP